MYRGDRGDDEMTEIGRGYLRGQVVEMDRRDRGF